MRKLVGILALCFLSTCGSGYAVAAPTCASTLSAVEVLEKAGVKPLILRGAQMKPFVKLANDAGSTGLESAWFIAVLFTPDGAALFFGNVNTVCGPMLVPEATISRMLKPV